MSRFYSKCFKIFLGVFVGCQLMGQAHAMDMAIPVDPFYARYDRADHIVFGILEKIEPADVSLEEFKEFDRKYIKKATLKIEKSWRGQKRGKIEFYFFPGADREQEDVNLAAKESPNLREGLKNILYLREFHGGKKVAEQRFGTETFFPGSPRPEASEEFKALELLKKGKKMEEVIKALPSWDRIGFKKYQEEKHEIKK